MSKTSLLLELVTAQEHLHRMWDALLAGEIVRVEDEGRFVCNVVPQMDDEDRPEVLQELIETIGYVPKPYASQGISKD